MDAPISNQTNGSDSCVVDAWLEEHLAPPAYSLFFMVGFPANCLSLYVAWALMRKGNSVAVYLFNLSVSDLLYTATLPVWIEVATRPVDGALCGSLALIMWNSFYVGSGLLCCIAVDRYLAVVHPLRFHCVREVRTAAAVSAAVWLLEALVHFHLLGHTGAIQAFSSRYLCGERPPMSREAATQALVRVVMGFLLPLLIMTFCCVGIMRSLQMSVSVAAAERRKVGLLLFCLLLTYIVAFVPYQCVMVVRALLEPGACAWGARFRDFYVVTVTTTTLNSTLDPIIYCLISESAQREIAAAVDRGARCFKARDRSGRSTRIETVC